MENVSRSTISLGPTLPAFGVRALVFQSAIVGMAIALPYVAHSLGAPVRYLLPMHWPVLLAGLTYGSRGGALTGLMAPLISTLISGFPLLNVLPSMTLELATYGLVAGLFRERKFDPFLSLTAAVLSGRIVFIAAVLLTHTGVDDAGAYFQAALFPGVFAILGQLAILPFVAEWWVRQERRK